MIRLFPDQSGFDEEGDLFIGEHDIRSIAHEYGTPLYLYHAGTIKRQVAEARRLLAAHYKGESEISYAGKTYLSLGFAKKIEQLGLTLDTVSLGEMMIARKAGFSAKCVHLHGNNKSEEELRFALEWGIDNIVVDSLDELSFLDDLARQTDRLASTWLRVTPGVNVDTHPYIQTADSHSKFGIPVTDGQAAQAIAFARKSTHLHISGLHMMIGSQVFQIDPLQHALKTIVELAEREDLELEQISPGGGWGQPYLVDQPEVDLEALISGMANILTEECQRFNRPLPKLVVEPGRWLVGRAGVSVYSVGTVKRSGDGTRFVAVDGGMADNPRPALYQAKYTAVALGKKPGAKTAPCTLVGRFCESGDQLIANLMLPDVGRGDLIVMPVSGAYQLSMSSNYNLTGRPAVLWLDDDRVEVLQSRERVEESWWWTGD